MKKLLLMILPAFICAGSLFAQTSTTGLNTKCGMNEM